MPRKPKAQKILAGTFRADRNPENEPEPSSANLRKPPKTFNKHSKKIWNDYIEELINCGVLTNADWENFQAMCEVWGIYREAREAVYSYTGDDGKKHKRTLAQYMDGRNSQTCLELNTMSKYLDLFKKFSEAFGMTPVSRNRIDLAPKKEKKTDPVGDMFEESNG